MDDEVENLSANNQPWLRLDTLAAFAHCPNAGLIAYLRQGFKEDRDPDRIPNLGYTPNFDFAKLVERLAYLKNNMIRLTIFSLSVLGLSAVILRSGQLLLALFVILALAPAVYQLIREIEEYFQVQKQIREYDESIPKPLPDVGTEMIPIHWWELVKSGYAPVLTDKFTDRENGFFGKPWRLLIDENSRARIPVVLDREVPENKLLSTHKYKMHLVFSAMLIELHEGTTVNWGLLLDVKTLDALAIPIHPSDKDMALTQLRKWQNKLREMNGNRIYQMPPDDACSFCKLGYPRRSWEKTMIGDEKINPNYYGILDFVAPETKNRDLDSSSVDDDSDSGRYFDSYADHYQFMTFGQWMRNSSFRPPLRHSDCGDVFEKPPLHRFWKIKIQESRERYRRWVERHARK
jgi:hypothetical protein